MALAPCYADLAIQVRQKKTDKERRVPSKKQVVRKQAIIAAVITVETGVIAGLISDEGFRRDNDLVNGILRICGDVSPAALVAAQSSNFEQVFVDCIDWEHPDHTVTKVDYIRALLAEYQVVRYEPIVVSTASVPKPKLNRLVAFFAQNHVVTVPHEFSEYVGIAPR